MAKIDVKKDGKVASAQKSRLVESSSTKVKKRKIKRNKGVSVARLPSQPAEFSSNWQRLKSQLQSNTGDKAQKRALVKNKRKVTSDKKIVVSNPKGAKQRKGDTKSVDCGSSDKIWFDVSDPSLLDEIDRPQETKTLKNGSFGPSMCDQKREGRQRLTKVLALDCEMVGVGFDGKQSVLARVSIVNVFGHCVLDKFVKPKEKVTNYRTEVSGIRPEDLKEKGESFESVQRSVYELIRNRILVGHSVHHDLKVLMLSHPKADIRDTAFYKPFKAIFNNKTPSLKRLVLAKLGIEFQSGEHNSVEDARAVMALYNLVKKAWEKERREEAINRRLPKHEQSLEENREERQQKESGNGHFRNGKMELEQKFKGQGNIVPQKYVDSDSD